MAASSSCSRERLPGTGDLEIQEIVERVPDHAGRSVFVGEGAGSVSARCKAVNGLA